MRYLDIKDHVINTTHSLGLIPCYVMQDLVGSDWYLPEITSNGDFLVDEEHYRIECITHARKGDDSSYIWPTETPLTEDDYYHVCSILVDGVPAFAFVFLREIRYEVPWQRDYTQTYILDVDATKEFRKIALSIYLDMIPIEDGVVTQHVLEGDELEELSVLAGVEIQYGPIK